MRLTRIVTSTTFSEKEFWKRSLLGRSLLFFPDALRPELAIRFENSGKWGLPEIYNQAIDECPTEKHLLFVHDDVYLHDLFLQHRIAEALGRCDVVGLAGSRGSDPAQPSWGLAFDADLKPVGWQTVGALSQAGRSEGRAPPGVVLSGAVSHVSRYVEGGDPRTSVPAPCLGLYGNFPEPCDLLDGLFLAANAALLQERKVGFDPQFRFHLYDLDFCRTAKTAGLRLSTWPILVSHGSGGHFDTEDFRAASRAYLEKWKDTVVHCPAVPELVECGRCGALLLPSTVAQHGKWHEEKEQGARSKEQAPDPDPDPLRTLNPAPCSLNPRAGREAEASPSAAALSAESAP